MTLRTVIRNKLSQQWNVPEGYTGIHDAEGLQAMNDDLAGSYFLLADIDLGGVDWTPIGGTTRFSGVFDGNGHTISNLTYDDGAESDVGLFGHVGSDSGTVVIKNLDLKNITVTGLRGVGTLIGRMTGNVNCEVLDCHCDGGAVHTMTGAGGGLFGSFNSFEETPGGTNNPHARRCSSINVDVSGEGDKIGGLSGCGQKGTFDDSYAQNTIVVENADRVGGMVGCLEFRGLVNAGYCASPITATTSTLVGGMVGYLGDGGNAGEVTDGYWDTDVSGHMTSADGVGLTTAEMHIASTYAGWDTGVWVIVDGGYPDLARVSTASALPRPWFADEYDGAVSSAAMRDVVYVHETETLQTPRGIGYSCREREELMQIHVYGPDATRGYSVKAEVDRILDMRGTRVRPDDECLFYVDRITRRGDQKRTYGYVYDVRGRYMEGYR